MSRFPFELIRVRDQVRVLDLEGEASCSSFTGKRSMNLVNRESGFAVKGKGIVNQKQKYAIRRHRRGLLEHRKIYPQSVACDGGRGVESLSVANGRDDDLQDEGTSQIRADLAEISCRSFEVGGVFGERGDVDMDSYSVENFKGTAHFEQGVAGNEVKLFTMMQRALEEEKATSASLYLELEKERAAAAIAADEAMAMILRLQEDKASLEMEAMQSKRMTEEKFAYDEEEMYILKEILVRRERKNHFLEKELEAYRQMGSLGTVDDFSSMIDNPSEDPSLVLQQYVNNKSIGEKEVGKTSIKLLSSMLDVEPTVHDVHVIDDNDKIWKDKSGEECGPKVCSTLSLPRDSAITFGASGVQSGKVLDHPESGKEFGKVLSDHPCTSSAETEPSICGSSLRTSSSLPSGNSRHNSLPASDHEILKIETAVEWLRERLQLAPEGKQKVTFSGDQMELKLLEETANQLLKIQQHKEPVQ